MEIQTNFQIISDEELSEIVGGGYPNNQSMNDVLHWLNGHNDGNPKQLPKWMCGLGWIRLTKYIYPNLKDNQKVSTISLVDKPEEETSEENIEQSENVAQNELEVAENIQNTEAE